MLMLMSLLWIGRPSLHLGHCALDWCPDCLYVAEMFALNLVKSCESDRFDSLSHCRMFVDEEKRRNLYQIFLFTYCRFSNSMPS